MRLGLEVSDLKIGRHSYLSSNPAIFYRVDSRRIRSWEFLECGKFDHQPTNVRLQKLVTINLVVTYFVLIESYQSQFLIVSTLLELNPKTVIECTINM